MCSSRKYPYPPQGILKEIPREKGLSKVKLKKPSVGGVWIFSETTQ